MAALAAGFVLTASLSAQTVPLNYQLEIQPIAIQSTTGHSVLTDYSASQITLFENATQRIFAQAGIKLVWDSWNTYVDGTNTNQGVSFYQINSTDANIQLGYTQYGLNGGYGQSANTTYSQNAKPGDTLNLWFSGPIASGILGYSENSTNVGLDSLQPDPIFRNGSIVSDSVFGSTYYSMTTIAHELARPLGLDTSNITSGPNYNGPGPAYGSTEITDKSNVMYPNTDFYRVTDINEITTDGTTGYGIFTQNQIDMMKLSPFITTLSSTEYYTYSSVPEPSDYALIVGAMAGLLVFYRRRRHASR